MMLTALHPSPTQLLPPSMEPGGVDATHQAPAELIEGLIQADSAAFPSRFQALLALMRLHIAEEGGQGPVNANFAPAARPIRDAAREAGRATVRAL